MEIIDITYVDTGELARGIEHGSRKVIEALAKRGVEILRMYFEEGGPSDRPWQELSEITIAMKGHSTKLRKSDAMMSAIAARQISDKVWEVGVYDEKAAIHEFGCIIPVTSAMRGYMASQGFPLSANTQFIVIPARPFMEPMVRQLIEELPQIEKEYMTIFDKLGKLFGR